jgi:predicted GNAT family acetyltransferase
MIKFMREGARQDPLPPREQLEARAGQGQHWFWTLDDELVSLAGILRRTRDAAVIGAVYTPSSHRGRGFAGAVVATVVERIFQEGRKIACLYTDLDNRAANRCYAKVGFRPVCDSWLYLRDTA